MKNISFFNGNRIKLKKRFSVICIALMATYSTPDFAAARPNLINKPSKPAPVSVDPRLTKPPVVSSIKPKRGIGGFSNCVYTPSFNDISIITEHHNLPQAPIYPQQIVALDRNTMVFTEVWWSYGYHVPSQSQVDQVSKTLSTLILDEDPPIISITTTQNAFTAEGLSSDYRALEIGPDSFLGISKFGRVNRINLSPLTATPIGSANVSDLDSDGSHAYVLQNGFLTDARVVRLWENGYEQELFSTNLSANLRFTAMAHFDNKIYLGAMNGGDIQLLQWSAGSSFTEIAVNANGRLDDLEAHDDGLVVMARPHYTPPAGQPFNMQDGDWQGSKLYLINQDEQSCEINLNYLWIEGQGANPDNTFDPQSSNFIDMDVISVGNGIIDIILVDSQDHHSYLPALNTQGRLVRVTINLNNVAF